MRIIAGTAKGHHIKAPKRTLTRPATDLVRGAIFAILENMDADWSRVLDLYSGSGALGIEALSRGAGWVDFIEHDPGSCAIIKQNLEKTKLASQARIYCRDVARMVQSLDKEYGIIIMDPPYPDRTIGNVITRVATSPLMGKDTVVVVTHSPHHPLEQAYAGLKMIKEHRHGDSCIAIYKKEDLS